MTEIEACELLKKANRNNDMVCILPKSDIGKCLIKALDALQQYREINTAEESRDADTKMKPRKVLNRHRSESEIDIKCFGTDTLYGECPVCLERQTSLWNNKNCGNCGQALDWR